MKQITLILFLGFITYAFSQNGFKLIEKAEKNIEIGNYDRALLLLEKADSANYGFCGNAWWEAQNIILRNKITIYDRQQNYEQCLYLLNNHISLDYFNIDSLKMKYFIHIFGKDSIKKELDVFLDTFHYSGKMEALTLDFTFFKGYLISYETMENIILFASNYRNKPFEEAFRNIFRSQPFYELLD